MLIKDLLNLPEQVNQGDFVLRLTEGVSRPEETIVSGGRKVRRVALEK